MNAQEPQATALASGEVSLESVLARIESIATLPEVGLRVMRIAQDPDASGADLKRAVEGDASLAARVLRMVNSAAYELQCTVNNLQQAINYLGFDQVRNLALTGSMCEVFMNEGRIGPYLRRNLWKHLVTVAICARLVARRVGISNFEDAFLAGLMHDIGIILIDQHANDAFRRVIAGLEHAETLAGAERRVFDFDHCLLGSQLAEHWGFPVPTRAAIRWHHDSRQYDGDGEEIVRCVEIANVICTLKGVSSVGRKLVQPPLHACKAMDLSRDDIVVLGVDLETEIAASQTLFEQ